jgi:hypothetical protein
MNDLADIVEAKTFKLTIIKNDGTPLLGSDDKPFQIDLAGPSHVQAFKAQNDMVAKAVRARRENKMDVGEPRDFVEHLVTRTLGWSPITWKGKPFPFSVESAFDLYTQSELVRRQVEVAINTPENFLPKTSKN